jgi:hypothetical protein
VSQAISIARRRAILEVLEAMAKHSPALISQWSESLSEDKTDEAGEVLLEWARIELVLYRLACGDDPEAMRALRKKIAQHAG